MLSGLTKLRSLNSITILPCTSSSSLSHFLAFYTHTHTWTHSHHLSSRCDIYSNHLLHFGVCFCFPWFILSVHEEASVWCCWSWSHAHNTCHQNSKKGRRRGSSQRTWETHLPRIHHFVLLCLISYGTFVYF